MNQNTDVLIGPMSQNFSNKIRNTGAWSKDQILYYAIFLEANKQKMKSKRKIREEKMFDRMANFIETRSSLQCRSCHNKFFEEEQTIHKIIKRLKKEVGIYFYSRQFRVLRERALDRCNSSHETSSLQKTNNNLETSVPPAKPRDSPLLNHQRSSPCIPQNQSTIDAYPCHLFTITNGVHIFVNAFEQHVSNAHRI